MAALLLTPGIAGAGQLVRNGDFSERLTGWQISERAAKVRHDRGGGAGPGSVKFELKGAKLRGGAAVSQEIPSKLAPGNQALLSFSWKKNWTGGSPTDQSAAVSIVDPNGKATEVWSDTEADSKDTWTQGTINLSSFLVKEGAYTLRLSAAFSNGGGSAAATQIYFDDIALSVPQIPTQPKTSILRPTGLKTLTGGTYLITGSTKGEAGVSNVRLAIVRRSDGLYWNGDKWVVPESWVDAPISGKKNDKQATWAYPWKLPTADGEVYALSVAATDKNGNREWPITVNVAVDTAGPGGAIFINEAASYTNDKEISVFSQISGASEMRFSISGGRNWTKWTPFSEHKDFALPPGDGSKILTGEFKDGVGNTFKVSSSIILDSTPPVTKMTFPSAGATTVKPSSTIGAVFYEEMNGSTFKNDGTEAGSSFYVKQGSVWVPGTVMYDNGSKTAKFIPATSLADGTTYTAYLKGVQDAAGNSLAADYSWSFTTVGTSKLSLTGRITKAQGGNLADGSGVFELTFPKDAVGSDTQVSLVEIKEEEAPAIDGQSRFSGIFKLGPDDLALVKKALVRIKYQPADGIDRTSVQIFMYDGGTQAWVPIDTRLTVTGNVAGADIDKPTFYMVAARADSSLPETTILNPAGNAGLGGKSLLVSGVASDGGSVSKVEVAVVRLKDGYHWDGTRWSPTEAWIDARITSGKHKALAAWSYVWTLPAKDGQRYKLVARTTDAGGNTEFNPPATFVTMPKK
ncbi:MAG: Ig-like domain-containing domain [Candidatus Aquicultorales bacterium]